MEKEERKVIQRLWDDIAWCVCRVGRCLRAFVCIKCAYPSQDPSGDLSMQYLPARQSESAVPQLSTSKCHCQSSLMCKKTCRAEGCEGKAELLCVTGLMALPRWRCPFCSHTTLHSPGVPKPIPLLGTASKGWLSHHQLQLQRQIKGWCMNHPI